MKRILIIIITMISILIPNIVLAASTFQIGLTSDKTEVKEGETLTISISLANLNVSTGERGIGAYIAKIKYDTDIFQEPVFSGTTNWEGSMNNDNITGVTKDGKVVKQPETIATLSLTVKENAKLGNTTVTISNFMGSDAVNDISANSKSIDIKLVEENKNQNQEDSNKNETNVENNTNTESNISDNKNTNNNVSTNKNTNTNKNNSANNNNTTTAPDTNTNDNTYSDSNTNNNPNSDISDNIDNNETDTNSNIDTTDNILPNEQQPQKGEKIALYAIFIVVILVLIVAIYIYYRKVILKEKIDK